MKSFEEFRQDTLTEGVLRKIVKPAIRWISKGKNKRIPNEKAASLKTLAKDDISQLGKFKNPKTGELEGTFLPNPTKPYQMKDFVQGKGGLLGQCLEVHLQVPHLFSARQFIEPIVLSETH